jgi:protein-S-isoprenylcysteine O-methyltransferase Ste14
MPRTALVLVVLWFVSLFAFRTALQWWRTGSTGIRGFSGRVGSLEWNAGLLASLGMLGSVLTPAATLLGWPGGALWFSDPTLHGVGIGVASLGIAGALLSQVRLGASWRIGVDACETTELVTRGLFGVVRNPIFSFMILSGAGLLAVLPTPFCAVSVLLTFAGIELQVRAVEEPHLERVHGEAYRRYAAEVGRFVPGVGLLGPAERGSVLASGAGSVD